MERKMQQPSVLKSIPLTEIFVGNLNVRKHLPKESLNELSNSLHQIGIVQPVVVREVNPNRYELIIGLRRITAAEQKGMTRVPATILQGVDDKDALILMLSENMQREDLTPFEEAWAILKLIDDFGFGVQEVAEKLAKNDRFIRTRMKLLNAPPEIQELVSERKLSLHHVDALASARSPEEQVKLARVVIRNSLTAEDLKTVIKQTKEGEKEDWRKHGRNLSAQRVGIRITKFTNFVRDTVPIISKFKHYEKEEIAISLRKLQSEVAKAIKEISK